MVKKTKAYVVLAVTLMVFGGVCMAIGFVGGGSMLHFTDFARTKYMQVVSGEESFTETAYTTFDLNEVKEIEIDIDAAKVIIGIGDNVSVRSENTESARIKTSINSEGVLQIEDERYGFLFDRKKIFPPTVYITIPQGMSINALSIDCEVGSVDGDFFNLEAKETEFSVDVGSINVRGITSAKTDIETSVGKITLEGIFRGETEIGCDVGSVSLTTTGSVNDWGYSIDSKFGDVTIDGKKVTGSAHNKSTATNSNHFDIESNLGSVQVVFKN